MFFAEMQRPQILDESVELGLAIARDLDPIAIANYEELIVQHNRKILDEQEEQRRSIKLASAAMDFESMQDCEDSCEGFGANEEIHFLRCRMFLSMLQETGERGLAPLTPEQFGRCFE